MQKFIDKKFLKNDDYRKSQFSIALIGRSGDGKTYLINYLIKEVGKKYDLIIYFSGSTIIEEDKIEGVVYLDFDTFEALEKIQGLKEINATLEPKDKIKSLVIFDDCVFQMDKTKTTTSLFKLLFMNNRHIPLSVIFSSQRICGELFPFVKSNAQIVIVKQTSNAKMLKDIYDDFFSIYMDNFNDFKRYYQENIIGDKKKYFSLFIARDNIFLMNPKFQFVQKLV